MTGSSHRSGWVLAGAQIAYVLVFAVCAWAVVSHGQDGPGPQGWWLLVLMIGQMGPLLAGISLVAAAIMLVFGYTQGRRPLTATLIVTSLAALASIAVAVSPAGQAAWGSILD